MTEQRDLPLAEDLFLRIKPAPQRWIDAQSRKHAGRSTQPQHAPRFLFAREVKANRLIRSDDFKNRLLRAPIHKVRRSKVLEFQISFLEILKYIYQLVRFGVGQGLKQYTIHQ